MQAYFIDQLGDSVHLPSFPKRIISLVPSQTELLYSLGLQSEVVGITKFCVHPEHWKSTKTIVGGTKKFWVDVIDTLNPDLIIGNKEENCEEDIVILRKKYPVWMSDIKSFENSLDMINKLGQILNKENKAKELVIEVIKKFSNLPIFQSKTVLYLIWRNPWMTAGRETFIQSMLEKCGLQNVIEANRYPILTDQDLQELNPDLVFLSSEPYPFKNSHFKELQSQFPTAKIVLVDGEMFSWYGSRLLLAPEYFHSLINSF